MEISALKTLNEEQDHDEGDASGDASGGTSAEAGPMEDVAYAHVSRPADLYNLGSHAPCGCLSWRPPTRIDLYRTISIYLIQERATMHVFESMIIEASRK